MTATVDRQQYSTKLPVVRCATVAQPSEDGARTAPVSLSKVVKLLTDVHSANLFDRHACALKKISKQYADGFLMRDLVSVFKILNVCADRVDENPAYVGAVSDILRLCSLPFLKEKISDELSFAQIAVECVEQLAYLMRVPNAGLRLQICETLTNFYCAEPRRQLVTDKYKPTSLSYNQSIVDKSDVAETIVRSLSLVDEDVQLKLSVLGLLQRLSKRPENCDRMLKAEAATLLCSRLANADPTRQLLFRSIEILWNLLENGSADEVGRQLNNIECMSHLRDAFIQQLTQGFSHYDRQMRNDLLVIASLVSSTCPSAPFLETGFARQLSLLATFQEVRSHNALVRHLKLPPNHENFEMKKLLINAVVLLGRDRSVLPVLSDNRVILALFSYVKGTDGGDATAGGGEWNFAQYEEIQLHAMAALCTLCPLMVDDYMTCQGSTRLLLMLEWCCGSDSFAGHGNGFHALGGYGNKRAQMRSCMRLIRSVTSTNDEAILSDFTEQGAINQFVSVLENLKLTAKEEKAARDAVAIDVEIQSDLLMVLSILCQNDIHRKELFGTDGVNMLIGYLKMDLHQLTSGLGHNCLLLTAIHCAWCAVIGCYMTEDYFLEREGVFFLIDLLDSCPRTFQSAVLGCLLDLLENQKTLSHVVAWRGRDDSTAPHLLCRLWREEEAQIKVSRDVTGVISNVERPLAGEIQGSQTVVSLPTACPSPAIVDVYENVRAKVYATFRKIGFVELSGLTTEDHVTLAIVEHYLDLKAGEVWTEIVSELEEECVEPVTPDREALEAMTTALHIRSDQITQVQRDILDSQAQQDVIDEQAYYAEIRDVHRQREKKMRDFGEFISRTSKHMLLRAAKEKQDLSIEASRVQGHGKTMDTFHDVTLPSLNITAFVGRRVAVESTPPELTGGFLATYDASTGTLQRVKAN